MSLNLLSNLHANLQPNNNFISSLQIHLHFNSLFDVYFLIKRWLSIKIEHQIILRFDAHFILHFQSLYLKTELLIYNMFGLFIYIYLKGVTHRSYYNGDSFNRLFFGKLLTRKLKGN